jgi:flagellar protein FlgJ
MMRSNSNYAGVFKSLNDPISYARAMQNAGYATDPNYAQKLAKMIFMIINVSKPAAD